jgi:hypothetical protein
LHSFLNKDILRWYTVLNFGVHTHCSRISFNCPELAVVPHLRWNFDYLNSMRFWFHKKVVPLLSWNFDYLNSWTPWSFGSIKVEEAFTG